MSLCACQCTCVCTCSLQAGNVCTLCVSRGDSFASTDNCGAPGSSHNSQQIPGSSRPRASTYFPGPFQACRVSYVRSLRVQMSPAWKVTCHASARPGCSAESSGLPEPPPTLSGTAFSSSVPDYICYCDHSWINPIWLFKLPGTDCPPLLV
jgi:hypothetical protein